VRKRKNVKGKNAEKWHGEEFSRKLSESIKKIAESEGVPSRALLMNPSLYKLLKNPWVPLSHKVEAIREFRDSLTKQQLEELRESAKTREVSEAAKLAKKAGDVAKTIKQLDKEVKALQEDIFMVDAALREIDEYTKIAKRRRTADEERFLAEKGLQRLDPRLRRKVLGIMLRWNVKSPLELEKLKRRLEREREKKEELARKLLP